MDDNKRVVGIIGTAVTAFICGCPGLCALMSAGLVFFGDEGIWFNSNTGNELSKNDLTLGGTIFLCLGLFMIVVPVVIAFFTFRSRGGSEKSELRDDEPIPPAI